MIKYYDTPNLLGYYFVKGTEYGDTVYGDGTYSLAKQYYMEERGE